MPSSIPLSIPSIDPVVSIVGYILLDTQEKQYYKTTTKGTTTHTEILSFHFSNWSHESLTPFSHPLSLFIIMTFYLEHN